MIRIEYVDNGAAKSIDAGISSIADLNAVFRKYIPWLRKDVDKVFDQQGPGWAPLAEGTKDARQERLEAVSEKLRAGAFGSLSRKLSTEQKRVESRLAKRETSSDRSERAQKLLASAQRASARQQTIRSEFERIRAGGSREEVAKDARKLPERIARREQRAESKIEKFKQGDALGQIANSIRYEVKGGTLEVFSEISWAGVHNDGGKAGKGATIPERKFLEWTPSRIAKFCEIASEYVADKMNKGTA